jgi:ribosomal protein S16
METNFKLLEQFLTESGLKHSDFYSITIHRSRVNLQGNFDKSVGLFASKYSDAVLDKDSGYIEFDFQYNGANINVTLT